MIIHTNSFANSVDPDQTAPKEQPDQDLHFLPTEKLIKSHPVGYINMLKVRDGSIVEMSKYLV